MTAFGLKQLEIRKSSEDEMNETIRSSFLSHLPPRYSH